MADIELEKEHNFDFDTAREKAKSWLDTLNSKYGLNVEYIEGEGQDVAKIKKSGVDAKAYLDKNKVRFEADLSFLAKPMKSKITEMVQGGLDKYLT